jgi:hypothetical protein
MNNKVKKIIVLILIFFLCFIIYSARFEANALTLKEMEGKSTNFINKGSESADDIKWNNVTGEFADLGSILTTIGAGVMVGVTAYMGIKYLTSGPEAQAKLKGQLIGVVVSGVVIFGAYYIWKIVVQIAETF